MKKKLMFMMPILLALFFVVLPVQAQVSVEDTYKSSAEYMVEIAPNPTYGDEWFILALARGGAHVPTNYFDTYYKNLVAEVKALDGELHVLKYTEYSRVILAVTAIGKDATNVGGYNLVEKLADFDLVAWQGLNGPIFALIALDSGNYELPVNATNSRERMVNYILSKQLADGGFSLTDDVSDADMTAMAIQALSSYTTDADVKLAADRAFATLVSLQDAQGHFSNSGATNAESSAQVITALTSMQLDPIKSASFERTLPNLLAFYDVVSGGFKHALDDDVANAMATEQAAYALAAYKRFVLGESKLYEMVEKKPAPTEAVPVVTTKPVMFSDMTTHWAKADVEKATTQGLLKGYDDGTFRPNKELTRVQAISILVRALKLEGSQSPFTDIENYNAVTKREIAAAYEAGLIVATGTELKPTAKISRQELAVMLHRAYRLQIGVAYEMKELAPLKDIAQLNAEAQQAITFLYDFKIAQGADGWYKPASTTTRAHAAKMFVQFLQVVK